MSETNTQTSLLVINSVAERLKAAGFRQTGVAAAVAEFVQECLGFHAKLSPNLMRAL